MCKNLHFEELGRNEKAITGVFLNTVRHLQRTKPVKNSRIIVYSPLEAIWKCLPAAGVAMAAPVPALFHTTGGEDFPTR
jgi:hypothetical protein